MRQKLNQVLVLIGILSTLACSPSNQGGEISPQDQVLKTYDVGNWQPEEVRHIINRLLTKSEKERFGKAQVSPDGQILVAAPRSFHRGVKKFLEKLKASTPVPSLKNRGRYWIMLGTKGKKDQDLSEFPIVQEALEAIKKNQGINNFSLVESLQVISQSSSGGKVKGAKASVGQRTVTKASGVSLDVELKIPMGQVNTAIEMTHNELVVLAQSFAPAKTEKHYPKQIAALRRAQKGSASQAIYLFYIVKSEAF